MRMQSWRHRRLRTRVLIAASAAAAVAAAGVTTALLARSAGHPPSPFAALTGALARTAQESYTFSVASTMRYAGRDMYSDVVSGELDPGHAAGTELLTTRVTWPSLASRTAQVRFIGKYVYTRIFHGPGLGAMREPWDKAPVPPSGASALPVGDLYGFVSDWPISPDELRGVLWRSAATVRDAGPASGPGWTGTRYAFTVRLSPRSSLSGIAYVDKQGRTRRLVTTTTQQRGITAYRNLTFGDFGAPVAVAVPPASQVQYTSRPNWGFYF
jgi:hypothetical protein